MDRLIEKIMEKRNPTVAGLDPRISYVPEDLRNRYYREFGNIQEADAKAILEFNTELIKTLADVVPAIKCQAACYEVYGSDGIRTLEKTIQIAHEHDLYVIVDGKRNDIGSTAECYSTAYLNNEGTDSGRASLNCDCLTVNGYLGSDGISPFLKDCEKYDKDIFALIKTSNPSSEELQNLKLENGMLVYEKMAELVEEWGKDTLGKYGFSRIGGVVGATWPEQLKTIRQQHPSIFFLVPGYGAQGGAADDIVGAFNEERLGAVVNNSRGIICAYQKMGTDYKTGAYQAAVRMKEALQKALGL